MDLEKKYCIVFPKGFKAGSVHSGIKKRKKDLLLIYSEMKCVASGVFTQNKIKAAPVLISEEKTKKEGIKAIIINSGNANACTGEKGISNAKKICKTVSDELKIKEEEVLISSTGVIGVQLPLNLILKGIIKAKENLGNTEEHGEESAESILTTDTFPKFFVDSFEYKDKEIRIGGICKGSGMINPNMATMLSFITTDISIEKNLLDEIIKEGTKKTFNCITVDGDTSTNDMFIILANGASGSEKIKNKEEELYEIFKEHLFSMLNEMAKSIIKDGEGSTKFIEVKIEGAKNEEQAIIAAKAIAKSTLVKTAAFGEDANWGRILSAIGNSGIDFDSNNINIYIGSKNGELLLCEMGQSIDFDELKAKQILKENEIYYLVQMDEGKGDAVIYTCDLSYDYIKINSDYRS